MYPVTGTWLPGTERVYLVPVVLPLRLGTRYPLVPVLLLVMADGLTVVMAFSDVSKSFAKERA